MHKMKIPQILTLIRKRYGYGYGYGEKHGGEK